MATKQIIWTTKAIDEVNEQINMGFYPKGDMNPFFEGTPGFRKPGLAFKMTQNELEEYIKCKMDIHYFSENYCYVKGDQGEPIKLKLRDYQKEVLDNFFNNRFNILMASRQVGKCNSLITNVLCRFTLSNGSTNEFYIPLFKILYFYKKDRTVYDYIKYPLYTILYKLNNYLNTLSNL